MSKRMTILGGALLALGAGPAWAGYQTCGNRPVADSVRSCPDGSIPIYHAGELPAPVRDNRPSGAASLFGVWHTSVPGVAYQTPSAVPGYDRLTVSPGAAAGDLTIDPNGTYVWNSYGGKHGRWRAGDAEYPIVLIDPVEKKEWKVGLDRGHLLVWDGYVYYQGRR